MTIHFKHCVSEDELAEVSLFLLDRKHDLHPSFRTLDMVTLLYQYITQGHLHCGVDRDGRIVGAFAYYVGAPEEEFADRTFVLIDIVISDRAYRGTRFFLNCLDYMEGIVRKDHPEVDKARFAALADNSYLCKLYAKFAEPCYRREGVSGPEMVFSERIDIICSTLRKYKHV